MGQTQYGFVRDYANAQAFDDYRKMGLGGILYNVEDPRFGAGLQAALAQGFQGGLWVPGATGADPIAYAHQLAQYAEKYHPSMLVPNIEFQGKGYKGSPGWDWSEKMMAEFRRLNPTQQLAVSVMGNQDDFNYGAYTGRGAQVWAQAYGGDMSPYNADEIRARLIANGVDPNLANVTLAPGGHAGGAGGYSVYTLDDLNADQRAQYAREVAAAAGRPIQATTAPASGPNPIPDVLAKTNRTALDRKVLGNQSVSHILTQKEINALAPRAMAVQTVMGRPPSRARTAARKVVNKTKRK